MKKQKYTKPQNFNPSQEDLSRVGKQIGKHISSDKVVVAGKEKIQGSKPYSNSENEGMILKPDPIVYGGKEISNDIQIIKEEEMITINLSDGDFELNKDLLHSINQTIESLQLSSIQDLKKVSEKEFFDVFTPLMNKQLNL